MRTITEAEVHGSVTSKEIEVSVVVPCFNSDKSIISLVERVRKVFVEKLRVSFEVVLIDDGSPNPNTWATVSGLADEFSEVSAIQLSRNFGKPGAVMCGYSESSGRLIVVMDDDLQHAPEDIPLLLEQSTHSLVMGEFQSRAHPWWQKWASSFKNWLDFQLIGKPRHVYLSPFHMVKREVAEAMLRINSPTPHVGALMMHVTKDVVMVPVSHHPRRDGETNFTFSRRLKQFSNLVINNSSLVLRLVAWIGIGFSTLSIGYGVYLVIRRFMFGAVVPGWTSIMVATLMIGGILMLSVGVIGEYLFRILNGLEGRSAFIVKTRVD